MTAAQLDLSGQPVPARRRIRWAAVFGRSLDKLSARYYLLGLDASRAAGDIQARALALGVPDGDLPRIKNAVESCFSRFRLVSRSRKGSAYPNASCPESNCGEGVVRVPYYPTLTTLKTDSTTTRCVRVSDTLTTRGGINGA